MRNNKKYFQVFSKEPDAGWSSDWFWSPNVDKTDARGPYPFKLWAWLAAWWATR